MTTREAIEVLNGNINDIDRVVIARAVAVHALEKQEKLKERIAKLTEQRTRNPWEEMFIGEVVRLLEEFTIGE